jgi:hypothetical protein
MRKDNDFNKYPTTPGEAVDTNMDHRVGINENLIDAVAYNGRKHRCLEDEVPELVDNVRVDLDKAMYEKNATTISIPSTVSLKPGESYKVEVTVDPFTANIPELVWESSDFEVATVNSEGVIVAGKKAGTATITATTPHKDGETKLTDSIAVTVA